MFLLLPFLSVNKGSCVLVSLFSSYEQVRDRQTDGRTDGQDIKTRNAAYRTAACRYSAKNTPCLQGQCPGAYTNFHRQLYLTEALDEQSN